VCAECPSRLARDLDGAFPDFLSHHRDLVYGIAMRLTKRPADAEDLAQEAFIRSYRALGSYPPTRRAELRPRGWLAAIVGNLARNRARRRQPASEGLEVVAEVAADEAPGPERLLADKEAALAWRRRLDALPPRYRRAVELRHVSGLSYPELAEALGRPIGTAKSDVHRGIGLLRESLLREAPAGQGQG
jgi:RNA polymerase sigma-70 factor (ECF subfamily)